MGSTVVEAQNNAVTPAEPLTSSRSTSEGELVAAAREHSFSSLNEEHLYASARAVVEAALWCHRVRGEKEVSEQTKSALIEAVFRDPSLTPHLFEKGALRFQWC